ncbi:hypothetical protein E4U19_000334 [Claviceps sp. Clav32 group G5]|nr:hypothetical protein E4U19_000334 [Claviceps sp. Clav32 group G5]KAG6033175.1 hypothetical protein E4U40_005584 [Claviceps sp. LM458 group G5]
MGHATRPTDLTFTASSGVGGASTDSTVLPDGRFLCRQSPFHQQTSGMSDVPLDDPTSRMPTGHMV